jgi:ketosteroid isomerase-like protein
MSQENVELLRSGYATPEPLTTFADRIAPDVEFDFTAVYPDQPVLRGTDAVRRFIDEGPWGGAIHFEPERFFDVDDERVLVFVRVTAIGQESGAAAEARAAHEFTIRDGLLVRFKAYIDRSEALEAVGLRQ